MAFSTLSAWALSFRAVRARPCRERFIRRKPRGLPVPAHYQSQAPCRWTTSRRSPLSLHSCLPTLITRSSRACNLIQRQSRAAIHYLACSSSNIALPYCLALLAAWKVAFFPRHNLAGMHNVEEDQSEQHHGRIENILVRFVNRNSRVKSLGILNQTEDDTDLRESRSLANEIIRRAHGQRRGRGSLQ